MPDASRYRGNTSDSGYTCELCHNITGKISMHSAGLDGSDGTCDTLCHNSAVDMNISIPVDLHNNGIGINVNSSACNSPECHIPPPDEETR